jgi:hypothetical protein
MYYRILIIAVVVTVSYFSSCRSAKKIQTAIAKKDSVELVIVTDNAHEDSVSFIRETYRNIVSRRIEFNTFSAKVSVNYTGADKKKYDVNAFLRMYKDSVIWISVNAALGIEALRALITKDSVKILDKQNKIYTARSVAYLQEVTELPMDLPILQDLIIGNPVFLDSNIVSYSRSGNNLSILAIGDWFKNRITLNEADNTIMHYKLDDVDIIRNRTCDLAYTGYENKKGVLFSTHRKIAVAEKSRLDLRLEFKQYDFNETLSFPFAIPKNYKAN